VVADAQALLEGTDASGAPVDAVLALVREVLENDAVQADDDIFDFGATSLSFVRVLARIRRDLGLSVHPADLDGTASATNLAKAARISTDDSTGGTA
jgi:acyl carrier protein